MTETDLKSARGFDCSGALLACAFAGAYAELEQGADGGAAAGPGAQPGALLASAAPLPGRPSSGGPSGSVFASLSSAPGSGGRGGSVFASLSMGPGVGANGVGLGKASRAVLGTLAKAARRAAPRPRLARPARVQGQQRQQGQGQQAAGAQQRRQQQQQQQRRQRVQEHWMRCRNSGGRAGMWRARC